MLVSGKHSFNLYQFQMKILPILLGWSIGSILVGLVWLRHPERFFRGLGSQFVGWGLVDGLIAGLGIRGASKNASRLEAGEIQPEEHKRQALNFERFVWLNVLLDFAYIFGGYRFKQRASSETSGRMTDTPEITINEAHNQGRTDMQRGIGWGIIIQGAFLLIWDIFLGTLTHQRRHGAE